MVRAIPPTPFLVIIVASTIPSALPSKDKEDTEDDPGRLVGIGPIDPPKVGLTEPGVALAAGEQLAVARAKILRVGVR